MNRENKRKLYDKHYYKTHPCDEAFTCKHCGRLRRSRRRGQRPPQPLPLLPCSVHLDNAPGDREADCGALMEPIGMWVRKNGEWALLTAAGCAARFTPTASRRMITRCC